MSEDKVFKIKREFYVGEFRGQINSQPRRRYIGIGSDHDDATMGTWLTVSEATRLRDALNEILVEPSDEESGSDT